jgi:hypothetical protein
MPAFYLLNEVAVAFAGGIFQRDTILYLYVAAFDVRLSPAIATILQLYSPTRNLRQEIQANRLYLP